MGTTIPSTVYGTNAQSCQYLLWHVARAARRVSQIFRLLFLGNGWADFVEICYALGTPLVTAYAVVMDGVSLHVRTCRQRFYISGTARPIGFNIGIWVGVTKYVLSTSHGWGGISTRAHVHAPPPSPYITIRLTNFAKI